MNARPDFMGLKVSGLHLFAANDPKPADWPEADMEGVRAKLAELKATPVQFSARTEVCTQPLGDETRRAWEAEMTHWKGPRP